MPREELKPKGLAGFITSNELVEVGKEVFPDFNKDHLWVVVAVGLVPQPSFNLPIKESARAVFIDGVKSSLQLILQNRTETVEHLRQTSTLVSLNGSHHSVDLDLADSVFMEGPVTALAEIYIDKAVKTVVGQMNLMSEMFSFYVTHSATPVTPIDKAATILAQHDHVWGWGADEIELQAIIEALKASVSGTASAMTLEQLFKLIDDSFERTAFLRESFDAWYKRSDARAILHNKVKKKIISKEWVLPSAKDGPWWSRLLAYPLAIAGVSSTIWASIVFSIEWSLRSHLSSKAIAYSTIAYFVVILPTLWRDFRYINKTSSEDLRLLPLLDSVGSAVVFFAVMYARLSAVGKLVIADNAISHIIFSASVFVGSPLNGVLTSSTLTNLVIVSESVFSFVYVVIFAGFFFGRIGAKSA